MQFIEKPYVLFTSLCFLKMNFDFHNDENEHRLTQFGVGNSSTLSYSYKSYQHNGKHNEFCSCPVKHQCMEPSSDILNGHYQQCFQDNQPPFTGNNVCYGDSTQFSYEHVYDRMAATEWREQSYIPNIDHSMTFNTNSGDSPRNNRSELPHHSSNPYQNRDNCGNHIQQIKQTNCVDSNYPSHSSLTEKSTSNIAYHEHQRHGSYEKTSHNILESSNYKPPSKKTNFRDTFNEHEVHNHRDGQHSCHSKEYVSYQFTGERIDPTTFYLGNHTSHNMKSQEFHSSSPPNSSKIISREPAINENVRNQNVSNKNKKYTTGYGYFFRDQHHHVMAQTPNATFTDLSKAIASKWRRLNWNQKQVYRNKVEKKPFSSRYGKFFHQNFKLVKKSNPEASFGQISSLISKKWDALTWYQRKSYDASELSVSSDWKHSYGIDGARANQLDQSSKLMGVNQHPESAVSNPYDIRTISDMKPSLCYSRKKAAIKGRKKGSYDVSEKLFISL